MGLLAIQRVHGPNHCLRHIQSSLDTTISRRRRWATKAFGTRPDSFRSPKSKCYQELTLLLVPTLECIVFVIFRTVDDRRSIYQYVVRSSIGLVFCELQSKQRDGGTDSNFHQSKALLPKWLHDDVNVL